jgi:predicted naringenin-chalcone synthase
MPNVPPDLTRLSLDDKRRLVFRQLQAGKEQEQGRGVPHQGDRDGFAALITDFEPLSVARPLPQHRLLESMAWLMAHARCIKEGIRAPARVQAVWDEVTTQVAHYGVSPDIIRQREIALAPAACADHALADLGVDAIPIYADLHTDPHGALLDRRMALYAACVDQLLDQAYPPTEARTPPDDLIHVTCSGYLAPSPVERLVSRRRWTETTVTHAYHMGCYGAFPALRMAVGFLAASQVGLSQPKRRIDVLHTEYLSLHADPLKQAPADIVSTSLFGDGFIKYALYPVTLARQQRKRGLKVLTLKESIIPDSAREMTWNLAPHAFDMYLSKDIPLWIGDHILALVEALLRSVHLDLTQARHQCVFAIHPGGARILDVVKQALRLEEAQVAASRKVLYEHGNMSSATIPYIWREIVADQNIPAGTRVISMAFGPGLTATGAVLEKSEGAV